jgi:hypothetical protein
VETGAFENGTIADVSLSSAMKSAFDARERKSIAIDSVTARFVHDSMTTECATERPCTRTTAVECETIELVCETSRFVRQTERLVRVSMVVECVTTRVVRSTAAMENERGAVV